MARTGRISRTQFLQIVGAALPSLALSTTLPSAPQATADRRRRIANLLQAYDGQGLHRTATPVDHASGDWLRRVVDAAGVKARLAPFAVDRVDVRAARLDAGGTTIEGLPFFDGGFTGETGLVGRLGPAGSAADIGLAVLDQSAIASDGRSLETLRRQTTHRAIVAVTRGGAPGLAPSNAASFAAPYGVPVLQVGSEHDARLRTLATAGAAATVVASAARTPDRAFNVVASLPGRGRETGPVVVVTPRSGWWRCTAERGGGLACFTETVRAAATASRSLRPVMFVAVSGHETGHRGFAAFLDEHAGLVKSAHAWIYLGANLGAAGGRISVRASDDELEGGARRALDTSKAATGGGPAGGPAPPDEARVIHDAAGRYVALAGTGPSFRTEQDRWPASTDVDAVARLAEAVSALTISLAAVS
jgi:hypothetical protein